jgi:hypothetical protein
MSLIIDCVWSEHRRDYVRFTKGLESNYDTIIDYHAISNKLAKSCPYGEEPNQSVVGLHIFKTLEATLLFHQDHRILYLLKNLEPVTIANLKEIVTDFYYREFTFNLTMISETPSTNENILALFDNVSHLTNDKA